MKCRTTLTCSPGNFRWNCSCIFGGNIYTTEMGKYKHFCKLVHELGYASALLRHRNSTVMSDIFNLLKFRLCLALSALNLWRPTTIWWRHFPYISEFLDSFDAFISHKYLNSVTDLTVSFPRDIWIYCLCGVIFITMAIGISKENPCITSKKTTSIRNENCINVVFISVFDPLYCMIYVMFLH